MQNEAYWQGQQWPPTQDTLFLRQDRTVVTGDDFMQNVKISVV